jgi:type IV/VI secretion system ImpK/VasF family protein
MKRLALDPQEQLAADQFRAFYARLVKIRDTVCAPLPPPADEEAAEPAKRPTLDALRAELAQAILDFGYRADDPVTAGTVDPGYVMAAVADEVLVMQCEAWEEYEAWVDMPLEAVLYGSALAGDRVFAAAEELMAGARNDPRTATIILLALLAGFRGRYQGRDDRGAIDLFQKGLYLRICNREYRPEDDAPYAAAEMGATTLTGASTRPLPALWPWLVALAALVLAYLPISHMLWWYHSDPTVDLAESIIREKPTPLPKAPE